MSKDRDYIKAMFDSDGIKAPESLSEENMLAMLEAAETAEAKETEQQTKWEPAKSAAGMKSAEKRESWRPYVKRWAAVAAAAVIALFGISGLFDILSPAPDTSAVGDELYTFRNAREIDKVLRNMDTGISFGRLRPGSNVDTGMELELLDGDMAESADAPAESADKATGAEPSSATGSANHSETYLQVEDVDEADIVKTDGKYIYYVNTDREVVILEAKDGKTKKLSTIGNSGVENYIHDIYLKGDKLITVGKYYKSGNDEGTSGIVVYDISDRTDPEVLYDFSQTGDILSSRMVGDYVYLVTNDWVYKGQRNVPMCGTYDSLNSMDVGDICCMPEPHSTSYIVLSAIDVSSGTKGKSRTKAVLGASDEIYCNDHNLYVTSAEYDNETGTYYTRIVRAALSGTDVKFNKTARVRGYAVNQFAMDEKDGYFRIATTSDRDGMDVNNLFVLDSDLKEAGSVTGFARNESIKSVRYFGDRAYVITYKAIDPLFIIDLSDPKDPEIEGEVMIDGFSTLLVPVSEGRLLGIGHATGDNGYGGEFDNGLKIVLFDISDPSEPKVLDSKEFKDMSSFAQSDHHALTINREDGWFAIPYEIYRYNEWPDGDDVIIEDDAEAPSASLDSEDTEIVEDEPFVEEMHEAGILVFTANDKFGSVDQHKLDATQLFRSVYIGEWIYALDAKGEVYSFKPAL